MFDAWIASLASPDHIRGALIINAIATWYMIGVILFVQVVHYPLFRDIGPDGFAEYSERNQWLTSIVVGPPMVVEALLSACLLVWLTTPNGERLLDGSLAVWNISLVIFIFGATALFSIPCHAILAKRYDLQAIRRLVVTNWLRTVAWLVKGLVAILMII